MLRLGGAPAIPEGEDTSPTRERRAQRRAKLLDRGQHARELTRYRLVLVERPAQAIARHVTAS
jgi:hypothetical protein